MTVKVLVGEPTRPRLVDGQGRELDQWGLPISGPARARRLAELGRPDPEHDSAGWAAAGRSKPARKPKNRAKTPKNNSAPEATPSAGAGVAALAATPVAPDLIVTESDNG